MQSAAQDEMIRDIGKTDPNLYSHRAERSQPVCILKAVKGSITFLY